MTRQAMKHNQKSGFSLIEVIIAFSILTITVVASTSLIANSIRANQDNILRVQAYFLAQEGLELARNTRDTNWLNSKDYKNEISKTKEILTIQENSSTNNGLYTFKVATGEVTGQITFERTVSLKNLEDTPTTNLTSNDYKDGIPLDFNQSAQVVTSEVSFGYAGESETNRKKVTLTTILTDWKQSPL
jgi:type II secretory pathway pseudopilin PulG